MKTLNFAVMGFLKLILVPALFLLTSAMAQADGLSLLSRNPFIWPGFDASSAAGPAQSADQPTSEDFEFHAVYELSGTTHVLLKDRRKNTFHWVSVGENLEGLTPKQYDEEKDQILLAYEDQEKWLALQSLPEVRGGPVQAQPQRRPTSVSTSSSSRVTRRSVVRPRTSTTTAARGSIRSSPGSSAPSRAALLRSRIRQASDPGTQEPTAAPPSPPAAPEGEPPDRVPQRPPGLQLPSRG